MLKQISQQDLWRRVNRRLLGRLIRGRRSRWVSALSVALISIAALTVAAFSIYNQAALASAGSSVQPEMSPPVQPASAGLAPGEKSVEVEIVKLTRFGFEPSQITRPNSQFLLSVLNRYVDGVAELRLDRVGGPNIRQQAVPVEQLNWYDTLELEPGDYVLTEANHPEWTCTITIFP